MGTRFMATHECPIHENVKKAIVTTGDTGTISWGHKTGIARTLKNRFTEAYVAREFSGATPEQLYDFIAEYTKMPGGRRVAGLRGGDLEDGEIYLGAGAGMIHDVISCEQVIRRTMQEAADILGRLNAVLGAQETRSNARERYAAPA
jgi:NAD(P)H-dependent flavin oxidoreductase YrpB (nitropropane dioxygenase family)